MYAALQYAASFSMFGGGMERFRKILTEVDLREQEKESKEASDGVLYDSVCDAGGVAQT